MMHHPLLSLNTYIAMNTHRINGPQRSPEIKWNSGFHHLNLELGQKEKIMNLHALTTFSTYILLKVLCFVWDTVHARI